jgi:hypothetical protein
MDCPCGRGVLTAEPQLAQHFAGAARESFVDWLDGAC